jgi:ribosomal protein S25
MKHVPQKLRMFFSTNPDEGLTHKDIAAKYECAGSTARQAIKTLQSEGFVKSAGKIGKTKVWTGTGRRLAWV